MDSTRSTVIPVGTLTLTGDISGSGTLTCTNYLCNDISDDVLELAGDNSRFTGILNQVENSASGTISTYFMAGSALGTGALHFDGGTFAASGTLANDIVIGNGGLTLCPIGALTLNGNISGSGTLTCTNYETTDEVLQLGGDNSGFTGTFHQVRNSTSEHDFHLYVPRRGPRRGRMANRRRCAGQRYRRHTQHRFGLSIYLPPAAVRLESWPPAAR